MSAGPAGRPTRPAAGARVTADELLTMSKAELDAVFRESPAGRVPEGRSRGTALVVPGGWVDRVVRGLIRALVWRGKVFRRSADGSSLKNLISPLSLQLFEARVYPDESWFSPGEAVILDYSESSFLVRPIRDEIRQVGEGLYLGQVYWGKRRLALFMLEFADGVRAVAPAGAPGRSIPPRA